MAHRLSIEQEAKKPQSISMEPSIWQDFCTKCYNSNSTPTKEIRKFILKFVKKQK